MYSWIWRNLPFGLPGKLIGSALLIGGATALLWFVAFPAVHQWMPFNQSTIEEDTQDGGGGGGGNEERDSDSDRVDDDPEDYELEESPTPDEEDGDSGDGG